MNQKKSEEQKPLPGKLKNRFRLKPKEKPLELNKFPNLRKRAKTEGKEKPLINNKKGKNKGIELYDKNGNKLAGTYVPAPKEGEKYDLYDKNGNKLDGQFKKIKGNDKIFDKNLKPLDPNNNFTPIVTITPIKDLFDKNGNKLKGNFAKLINPIKSSEVFDKNGEPLDGKYADIISSLPTI